MSCQWSHITAHPLCVCVCVCVLSLMKSKYCLKTNMEQKMRVTVSTLILRFPPPNSLNLRVLTPLDWEVSVMFSAYSIWVLLIKAVVKGLREVEMLRKYKLLTTSLIYGCNFLLGKTQNWKYIWLSWIDPWVNVLHHVVSVREVP